MISKLLAKRYKGQIDFKHGRQPAMGVLVVNLGTPDEPTTESVRTYLGEFLSDPRVVEIPQFIWKIVLYGIILRTRPAKSAAAYQKVWKDGASPLMTESSDLTKAIDTQISSQIPGKCIVRLAMRYGQPSIQKGLDELQAAGAERILVLPLYPQYSGATTGSVADEVFDTLKKWRWVPELRLLGAFHDNENYVKAVAESIRENWESRQHPENDSNHKLCFSFHGMPRATLSAGDPYFCQCHKSARLIADELGLQENQWEMAFQSRFGKAEWLQPYFAKRIEELPGEGIKNLTVVCPGFSVDCLETLEEIAMEGKEDFLAAGGETFHYVPALNSSPSHVELLSEMIIKNSAGWPELEAATDEEKLSASKSFAIAEGGQG